MAAGCRIPQVQQGLDDCGVAFAGKRLNQIRCAEGAGLLDIARMVRIAEDDSGQIIQRLMVAQPDEDVKAVGAGHFEVEENQVRQRMDIAIGKVVVARQIFDGLIAIADASDVDLEVGFVQSKPKKEKVVFVVFGNEKCWKSFVHRSA
jgi:hypothetical protein